MFSFVCDIRTVVLEGSIWNALINIQRLEWEREGVAHTPAGYDCIPFEACRFVHCCPVFVCN